MKSRFKCSMLLSMALTVSAPSISQAQSDDPSLNEKIHKLMELKSLISGTSSNAKLNEQTSNFVANIKQAEMLRNTAQAGAAPLSPKRSRTILLNCRPQYWESRFMPSPYYHYISHPDLVCDF